MSGRPWGTTAVAPELWERIARVLKAEEGIGDAEVARRLGCARRPVASVRRDLGIMPSQSRRRWTDDRFGELIRPLPGGHQLWEGRIAPGGTPMAGQFLTVYQWSFRLHHGRKPFGRVYGVCRRSRCVAGPHLQDDLMRALDPDRLTLRGLDLLAIRTALSCDPPYPPLKIEEARLAFRLADLDVPGPELSARLSICARTFERWKAKGAPSPW
ncbi:hypothetical protein ACKI16_29795 [Streptomyces scabiei]|uniref:hypothetical protein n=1 Tax=Streptomyces scabiei TaxID=1930 RepID=UPI0038F69367